MQDGIRRWITGEGTFRILAVSARATVEKALSVCDATGAAGELYGEMLLGGALYQIAFAPADRVQFALENEGEVGKLLADIRPGVALRGQIENPEATEALVGAKASMRVSRQSPRGGGYYESIISVPGEKIADAFQVYALQSDQVLTFMALDVSHKEGELVHAAGLFVQALPGATHDHLAKVTHCLEETRFKDQMMVTGDPFAVVPGMFYDLDLHELGTDPLMYRCGCSKASLGVALGTLSTDNLMEMAAVGRTEAVCEFCRTQYVFSGDEIRGIHDRKIEAASELESD